MGVGGPVVPVGGGGGGPAVPNLAGGSGPAMAAGGHAALAAAINVEGADPAAHADDARTLAISRDVDGLRFKRIPCCGPGVKADRVQRLADLRAKDSEVCPQSDARPWWLSDGASPGLEGGLQASTYGCTSHGTRGLVEGSADFDDLRSGRCDQLGRWRDDSQGPSANRGEGTNSNCQRWTMQERVPSSWARAVDPVLDQSSARN